MSRSLTTKKAEIVTRILRNETYQPDSGVYKHAFNALLNLSKPQLLSIELVLTFREVESNNLAVKVNTILNKETK